MTATIFPVGDETVPVIGPVLERVVNVAITFGLLWLTVIIVGVIIIHRITRPTPKKESRS